MNTKIITISLAAVLGVAGGAYMLVNSGMNFTQYIPESISKYLGTSEVEESSEFVDNAPTFIYEEQEEEQEEEQVKTEQALENTEQPVESSESVEVEEIEVQKQASESVSSEPVPEPEPVKNTADTHNESAEDQVYREIAETVNKNMSSEEVRIAEQIQSANSEIYKLVAENKELEALFQKIIKQNRALAEKLRELDGKIAALN